MDGAITRSGDVPQTSTSQPAALPGPRRPFKAPKRGCSGERPLAILTATLVLVLGGPVASRVWGQPDGEPSDATPQPAAEETEAAVDLPPGVQPPKPPSEIMTMVKPLDYARTTSAERTEFESMRRQGVVTNRAVFDKVLTEMVYKMTDPKEYNDLHRLARDIVMKADGSQGQFRDALIEKLVQLLPGLFDNRLAVRVNAMGVMKDIRDERFVPAMVAEIDNPKQHPAVKYTAVMGLELAPRLTQVSNRDLVLRSLVNLVKNDKTAHGWTRAAAARTIGKLRQARIGFVGNQADVVDALMILVTDPEGARHYPNQCYSAQAARAIGDLEIKDLDVDFAHLAVEFARLATRMGERYLKDSQESAERKGFQGFPDANWKVHFEDLTLAFHGEPRVEGSGLLTMAVVQPKPTVETFANLVTELYLLIAEGEADATIREQINQITAEIARVAPEGAGEGAGEIGQQRVPAELATNGTSGQ